MSCLECRRERDDALWVQSRDVIECKDENLNEEQRKKNKEHNCKNKVVKIIIFLKSSVVFVCNSVRWTFSY